MLSIVSIGPKTAAVLLAELGDVRRFANVRDVVAYVGLCPRLCSSGSSLHGPTPLTKRGNAVVRKALYFPALNALRFNPCLRPFYHRLLAQGKPKMVAVAAVMRKLLHLVYGVLCSGHPFDAAHVSLRPAPASSQGPLPHEAERRATSSITWQIARGSVSVHRSLSKRPETAGSLWPFFSRPMMDFTTSFFRLFLPNP